MDRMDIIIVHMMNGYHYCLYDEWMEWEGNIEKPVMPSLRGKISQFCP